MFFLHETTQRRVCRVMFLLVCVVPTLLTLAAVAYCNRPWRQADWQEALSQQLHVRAELGDVRRPRPGQLVLSALQLSDLRTDRPLGQFDQLQIEKRNSRVSFQADHLELQAEQLPALATAISTWIATTASAPLELSLEQLTIRSQALQVVQLKDLSITCETSESARQQFHLTAHNDAGKPIKLVLEQDNGLLRCTLNTQAAPLPAWLMGTLAPGIQCFGEAAFSGRATSESSNQQVRGTLQGKFTNVDLQTWIGQDCPHQLLGKAKLEFEQLVWAEQRIELAQGKLEANHGMSSYSLLLNARDLCQCVTGPRWETLRPTTQEIQVPFDQFALAFQLTAAGIKIVGQCDDGALVTQKEGPLLFGPAPQTVLSVGQLVQLLDYRRQPGWLPATLRAHEMIKELPLPEARNVD